MSIHTILRDCALDLLATEREVEVEKVVTCAWRNHPDEFAAEQQRMILAAATRAAKEVLRGLSDEDDPGDEPRLPGLDLPYCIAVPRGDTFVYVHTEKATWDDLVAGEQIRADNVDRAQRKLDSYRKALRRLQPLMEHRPDLTVAAALARSAA